MVNESSPTLEAILGTLSQSLSEANAKTVLSSALRRAGGNQRTFSTRDVSPTFLSGVEHGLRLFGVSDSTQKQVRDQLMALRTNGQSPSLEVADERIAVAAEKDIVEARAAVRRVAIAIGFGHTDQVKITTVASELARNIHAYAGSGEISVAAVRGARPGLRIVASDRGTGIRNLNDILGSNYRSKTGMGLGLLGCKRLMDEFHVDTGPKGTEVTVVKYL